jgi:hypothetical protein
MADIYSISEDKIEDLSKFLKSVESINDIDTEVVKNGVYISEGTDILGMVSYEGFNNFGLIRYFEFKKNLDMNNIVNMFEILKEKSIKNGIKYLFSIINEEKIMNLFKGLGFNIIDKNYFFIEEKNVLNTKYKDSTILMNILE